MTEDQNLEEDLKKENMTLKHIIFTTITRVRECEKYAIRDKNYNKAATLRGINNGICEMLEKYSK